MVCFSQCLGGKGWALPSARRATLLDTGSASPRHMWLLSSGRQLGLNHVLWRTWWALPLALQVPTGSCCLDVPGPVLCALPGRPRPHPRREPALGPESHAAGMYPLCSVNREATMASEQVALEQWWLLLHPRACVLHPPHCTV